MKRSELDRMMTRVRELSDNADPDVELLGIIAILCGEQLLQMGEVRKMMSEFAPKIDATANAVSDLEDKIAGKLAVTRYDFGDK